MFNYAKIAFLCYNRIDNKKKGVDRLLPVKLKFIKEDVLGQVICKRPINSHKGDYGKILLVAGSSQMGGAALMATSAAVHSGAGLVTCATSPKNRTALHTLIPEAMFLDYTDQVALVEKIPTVDVIVVGPGLAPSQMTIELLELIFLKIKPTTTLVIDGTALTLLAKYPKLKEQLPDCPLILTPHQMEWQRLSQIKIKDQGDRLKNQHIQHQLQATVVLKKFKTEIYHKEGTVSQLTIGGPYMATGGMGDTLTGIIAAFLGQFKHVERSLALEAAVYLHSAVAKELAQTQYVVLPTTLSAQIPFFMARYQN